MALASWKGTEYTPRPLSNVPVLLHFLFDALLLTSHRYADIVKTMVKRLKNLYILFTPGVVSGKAMGVSFERALKLVTNPEIQYTIELVTSNLPSLLNEASPEVSEIGKAHTK